MPHWKMTINKALLAFPISLLQAAIAATQGVYNKVNNKNEKAEIGVNTWDRTIAKSLELTWKSTLKDDTTASFALKPVIKEVATRQSPKPNGANIGAMNCPIKANKLSEVSLTTFNFKSKLCKNQTTMNAKKIMVKAFVRKSFALSHISNRTLLALGKR